MTLLGPGPSPYSVHASHPIALVVGLLVALALGVQLLRTRLAFSRPRRLLASALGWLALVAAVLAAGEVELLRPADRMTVVVAADSSRSIDLVRDAEKTLRADLTAAETGMRRDDRLGVVRFAATAALAEPMHAKGESGGDTQTTIARDATDIEAGVRRAVDEVLASGGGRVVVVSDGVANRGDSLAAAARARALGVPVDAWPLEQQVLPDVRVVAARGPALADEGEAIELRAVVHTPPRARPIDVEVKVSRDGAAVSTFTTKVSSGEDVIRFKDRAPDVGLHRYDLHVRPLDASIDASADDNEATTYVRVRGPSTVLVLQKDEARSAPVRTALQAEGYRVVVKGRYAVPVELAELAAFDLVVLADIPAKDLVPTQMTAIAQYVKDFGGGLILLGSESSMGPGGYARTPVEEVSPVTFDLTRERRRAQLSELIVVDYSGSMAAMVEGGLMKIDLANEAAARAAALLGPGDRLGVWHVDTTIRETIPIGPVGDAAATGKKIRSVGPGGGGIYIDLSLREGYKALAKEGQNLRHMLLFSDGADAEERNDAPNLVRKAASAGITTSVIALGDGQDAEALAQMAKLGGGRFYLITDARKLPAVFAQETILAARSSMREEEFVPRVRTSAGAIKGLSIATAPPLLGYVVTQPRPRAQVILDAIEGDPLLAMWPIGLGHAAAWTSDFSDRWASAFVKWPGAAQLFTQLAREIGRKADDARVRLDAVAQDGMLRIAAEPAHVAGGGGLLRLRAHVEGPDAVGRDVDLLPAPGGKYVADVPVATPGAYVVRALDIGGTMGNGGAGSAGTPAGLAAAVLSRADELRPTGSDRRALERIAELTGGVVTSTLRDAFARRTGLRPTALPLAPYLLAAALALMILGVAARRLGVPAPLVAAFRKLSFVDVDARSPSSDAVVPVAPLTAPAARVGATKGVFARRPATARAGRDAASDAAAPPPSQVAPPVAASAAAGVAGVASRLAQRRRDAMPRTGAIVARVDPPRAPPPPTPSGEPSLAALAKKRRERRG